MFEEFNEKFNEKFKKHQKDIRRILRHSGFNVKKTGNKFYLSLNNQPEFTCNYFLYQAVPNKYETVEYGICFEHDFDFNEEYIKLFERIKGRFERLIPEAIISLEDLRKEIFSDDEIKVINSLED